MGLREYPARESKRSWEIGFILTTLSASVYQGSIARKRSRVPVSPRANVVTVDGCLHIFGEAVIRNGHIAKVVFVCLRQIDTLSDLAALTSPRFDIHDSFAGR